MSTHPDDEELGMEPNAPHAELADHQSAHIETPFREYPKMKYHHGNRETRIVENREQERELGAGWRDNRWPAEPPEMQRG